MSTAALPRPAERVAIISLLLVFLCGGLAGAIFMNYWERPGIHSTQPMNLSVKQWKEQLNLSDDQTRQLTSILDDFAHYYDNLLADGNTRVLLILNDEQKRRYEQMIQRHKK
jgi:hypothetical protein